MNDLADLDEDEADLALMRIPRKRGESVSEAALQAADRYVARHYPKGQIPAQLLKDFPAQVKCPRCREESESSNTQCPHCQAPIYLHWTSSRDDCQETSGGAR